MKNTPFYKLILVTHKGETPSNRYLERIKICAKSGITAVQLREKEASHESLVEFGRKIKEILDPLNIPLIINDSIETAIELDAAGVHLGQSDGDPVKARRLLGAKKIIGISVSSLEELHRANALPIDYVGIGPIFSSTNKKGVPAIHIAYSYAIRSVIPITFDHQFL